MGHIVRTASHSALKTSARIVDDQTDQTVVNIDVKETDEGFLIEVRSHLGSLVLLPKAQNDIHIIVPREI